MARFNGYAMSSAANPRKFSEKIAIMERKQNEENRQFEEIMSNVRNITRVIKN